MGTSRCNYIHHIPLQECVRVFYTNLPHLLLFVLLLCRYYIYTGVALTNKKQKIDMKNSKLQFLLCIITVLSNADVFLLFEVQKFCTDYHTLGHDKVSMLTLKVLVRTIDAQWEGMGDVGSARYKPALLPPSPTIRVLSYSN